MAPQAPQRKSMECIATHNLTIAAGSRTILRSVSLRLFSGAITGLLGASGSGKSTLGRALLGRILPGMTLVEGTVDQRVRVAMIPQEPNLALSPFLRAGSQVLDAAAPGVRRPDVLKILDQLGFANPAEAFRKYPHQLSGGEQQRLVWAQALLRKPGLLIADEPTTALDAVLQRDLAESCIRAARGMNQAVLWISHDPHLLRAICSRILVLHEGQVIEDLAAAGFGESSKHPQTRRLWEASR